MGLPSFATGVMPEILSIVSYSYLIHNPGVGSYTVQGLEFRDLVLLEPPKAFEFRNMPGIVKAGGSFQHFKVSSLT